MISSALRDPAYDDQAPCTERQAEQELDAAHEKDAWWPGPSRPDDGGESEDREVAADEDGDPRDNAPCRPVCQLQGLHLATSLAGAESPHGSQHYHCPISVPLQIHRPDPRAAAARARLVRRARWLAWGGNAWHVAEFAIAVGAGVAASSVALIGFGLDSLIEVAAGSTIAWLLAGRRLDSATAERTAQRLVASSYFLLAGYIAVESSLALLAGDHPEVSWIGIGLAAVTAPTMPALAIAKRRVGRALGSRATESEGMQNMICAYLSVALLIGLGANALAGWWWADPAAALVIEARRPLKRRRRAPLRRSGRSAVGRLVHGSRTSCRRHPSERARSRRPAPAWRVHRRPCDGATRVRVAIPDDVDG
jgi:hypothetical protein